jgi:RNA-binding protein
LRRLGTALHLVQKKLIVHGEPARKNNDKKLPRINSIVVNHKRVKIGRIFDVFGPTDTPYIVVQPYRKVDATVHLGKKLYVEESRS